MRKKEPERPSSPNISFDVEGGGWQLVLGYPCRFGEVYYLDGYWYYANINTWAMHVWRKSAV